ncbi:MAG: 4-alpha-glucanotransferase [Chloroflexota bacterium]
MNQRRSGLLLHPTSLPSPYGVGTLGQAALDWVDFLHETHQTLWQVLPLGPTGYGDSPYQSFSTFAGNPYLIDLDLMVEEGLLNPTERVTPPQAPSHHVDYGLLYNWKRPLLYRAANHFYRQATQSQKDTFEHFCAENQIWLDDFALFMALKDAQRGLPWNQWPMPLRSRQPDALETATETYADAIHATKFSQWLFAHQWQHVKAYANQHDIQIVGDIPIFVAMDSSDAWSNPAEFELDDQFQPTIVAGVPPDYFSETGQLWGNPLYRWERMKEQGYDWWIQRIEVALTLYDIVGRTALKRGVQEGVK